MNIYKVVFWDMTTFGFIINRRFGGTCRLHLQGRRNDLSGFSSVPSVPPSYSQSVSYRLTLFFARFISSTLKIEATRFSETSVYNKPARHNISEYGILRSRRGILITYTYEFIVDKDITGSFPVHRLQTGSFLTNLAPLLNGHFQCCLVY
jgi:hypothetical protein